VTFDGEGPLLGRIVADSQADTRYAGRVDHTQVVAGLDREPPVDLDLATEVDQKRAVGHVQDPDALELSESAGDRLAVGLVATGHGDVPHHHAPAEPYDVEGVDVTALVTDGGRQASERAGPPTQLRANGQTVAGARLYVYGGHGQAPFSW